MTGYDHVLVDESPYGPSLETVDVRRVVSEAEVATIPENYKHGTDKKILHRTFLNPSVQLFNITFLVRKEGQHVYLQSDRWPILSAFGETFQEAVSNLIALMKDVVLEYVMVPEETLAVDAREFRNFLIGSLFSTA
jgi:hypothetical protein